MKTILALISALWVLGIFAAVLKPAKVHEKANPSVYEHDWSDLEKSINIEDRTDEHYRNVEPLGSYQRR